MMRRASVLVVFALAASLLSLAGDTLEQLKARAEAAHGGEQVKLCLEVANRELKLATDAFEAGDIEKGHATVEDIVTYAERAGDSARTSGKHLKKTEIEVRRIANRLDDIGRALSLDDRAPLQAAVKRLEHVRTQLLARMFGEK
jgi:hypothetical protein